MRLFLSTLFTFILIAPEVGAQTCGTSVCTGSEICIATAGLIDDCEVAPYFSGDFPWGTALLDNYGGFPSGTRVFVEGCAKPGAFGLCQGAYWSIRDNTIRTLTPPVPALGRSGQVLTVLLMLGIGSFGVWRFRIRHP